MTETQSYGTYGLMQSGAAFANKKIDFTAIEKLDTSLDGQTVWIRGRLHISRVKGKSCFASIRHQIHTVQICGFAGENFSKEMIKFIGGVSRESIVDVEGAVVKVDKPIQSCTQSNVELSIKQFFVVSASEPQLPLQIEDASRPVVEEGDATNKLATVNLDTRLDNRLVVLFYLKVKF